MSLANVLANQSKETDVLKLQLRSTADTLPSFRIMDKEKLTIDDRYIAIYSRDINNSFILGHATNGTLSGTLGDYRGGSVLQRALAPDDRFYENFKDSRFNNTAVTTANWDTTNHEISFGTVETPYSLEFDGNTYGSIGTDVLTRPGTFSVELWFYVKAHNDGDSQTFIGNYGQDNYGFHFGICDHEDHQYMLEFVTGNGSGWDVACWSSGTYTLNTWTHGAAVYNGGTVVLYLNGASVGTDTGDVAYATVQPLVLGFRNNVFDYNYFNGLLDEVRFYDYALSSADVVDRYNAGAGSYVGTASGLIGGWHMDEGTGGTAADCSGNDLDVILQAGCDFNATVKVSIPGGTVGNIAQSGTVIYNGGTITSCELNATASGTLNYYAAADGSTFESVTSGAPHTFSTQGSALVWKAVGETIATLNSLSVKAIY